MITNTTITKRMERLQMENRRRLIRTNRMATTIIMESPQTKLYRRITTPTHTVNIITMEIRRKKMKGTTIATFTVWTKVPWQIWMEKILHT